MTLLDTVIDDFIAKVESRLSPFRRRFALEGARPGRAPWRQSSPGFATAGEPILCHHGDDFVAVAFARLLRNLLASGRRAAHSRLGDAAPSGLLFFAWTLFFLSQALLVANRKLRESPIVGAVRHSRWRRP